MKNYYEFKKRMRDDTVVFVNGSMCVGSGVRVRVSEKRRGHDSAKV